MYLCRSYLLKKYDGAEFGYVRIQSNDYLIQRCSSLSLQYCTDSKDFTAFILLRIILDVYTSIFCGIMSDSKPFSDIGLSLNTSSLQVYLPLEYDLILKLVLLCL